MRVMVFVFILLLSVPVWANKMGVGVAIGNPTGLNGKYWLDNKSAVDGGVGFSIWKHPHFNIHSDYLLHSEGAFFLNDVHPLDLYYGVGGRMKFSDDINLGLRVPVGLAYKVEDQSADTFVEVAPIFDFLTNTGVEINLMAGARYYF